jgi:hypothetical protein
MVRHGLTRANDRLESKNKGENYEKVFISSIVSSFTASSYGGSNTGEY